MQQFLWRLFQGSIIGAVVLLLTQSGLTDNHYLAGIIGIGVAIVATWLINQILFPARQ
jgi:putative flippase GtrA